ncbi:sulfite exporter TauE/SafE family protein [Neptunicella sp. SCSIO 80796]|uniref:sulfite exporter TauE/SafE family protein n=1 Tax=Neptunicella plasticusilytica TaxID=3117012 RepID=UPI003A4D6F91
MFPILLGALFIGLSLGIFGSGGSILTVPVLVYLGGQDPKVAIAGSLLVVASISFVSTLFNLPKRYISWKHVIWLGLPGILGTVAGSSLADLVSGAIQLLVFAVLMLLAVVFMWRNSASLQPENTQPNLPLLILQGATIGVATGFVGVGGGFLIVPALVLIGHLAFYRAAATSLVIIVINSSIGFIHYQHLLSQQALHLNWPVLAILSACGIAGSFVGQKLVPKLPRILLQKSFAIFLLGMASFVIYQTLPTVIA